MSNKLPELFNELHALIEQNLQSARRANDHAPTKGDASENAWREMLNTYLPKRYCVTSAHAIDSNGKQSEQLDIVIYDRQYSPFVFHHQNCTFIPAESIYAVFEAKQVITAQDIRYAEKKVASVRALQRTSLPIPTANGEAPVRPPKLILGGFLSLESSWKPPLGGALISALTKDIQTNEGRLDIGCVASHGIFVRNGKNYLVRPKGKPATALLLELIAQLQSLATVPMIDIRAYARWLEDN